MAPREPLPHLLLLLGPIVHHITKARNGLRPVPPEISVYARVGDAVVKAVDDVLLRDVRDGGADVEEATRVGP
jgi:chaperonin cofactor prefoldin